MPLVGKQGALVLLDLLFLKFRNLFLEVTELLPHELCLN